MELLTMNTGGCFRRIRFANANSMRDQQECHVNAANTKQFNAIFRADVVIYRYEIHLNSMRNADLERQRIPKLSFMTEIK